MLYETIILMAAKAAKVSGTLLLAICIQESDLNNVKVHNDKGSTSYGICQIKHSTAQMVGYEGKPEGLMNPKVNAKYAALYLKYQTDRYNNNLCKAVAAYNAGTYTESKKSPGYPRNLRYVQKVQKNLPLHAIDVLFCGPPERKISSKTHKKVTVKIKKRKIK